MRINTNISSLSALRNLSATTKAFSRAMARLASGRRITSARDDAAGLAIAEGLEAQRRGMIQAVRNMNDGKGFLDTAEGALATQTGLVQRMKELAMQAANGTLSNTDRGFLNSELQQLLEEFNRITSQTTFNGVNLLDGSFGTKSFQVGTQKGQTIDVAMANMQASGIFVLRATVGTGTFQTRVTYTAGSASRRVSTGDFNGDGVTDLVTSGSATDVSIFLGRSDGTFQARTTLSTNSSFDVQTADLNGDGKLDLFSTTASTSYINIWLGNGNGTFGTRTTSPTSGSAYNLTYGDINGDGITDIVTSELNGNTTLSVLIGNGNGTFALASTLARGANLRDVRLVDLNGDGKLDLVSDETGNLSISLGNGDGTFATRTTVALNAGWTFQGISPGADLNGDGKTDLVLTALAGSSRLHILFGNGDGTFPTPSTLSATPTTLEAYPADLNGDGFVDIISADFDGLTVSVYMGNGDGSFAARTTLNNGGNTLDVTAKDVNGDGVLDILSTDQTNGFVNVFIANSIYKTTTPVVTIATQTAAQNMLSVFDNALTTLNSARANIGGLQNRLGYAESAANTLIENVSASKSQIMDTDFASDIAEMTRLQILQTAGVSVLSQANLSFKLVLKLLERI